LAFGAQVLHAQPLPAQAFRDLIRDGGLPTPVDTFENDEHQNDNALWRMRPNCFRSRPDAKNGIGKFRDARYVSPWRVTRARSQAPTLTPSAASQAKSLETSMSGSNTPPKTYGST